MANWIKMPEFEDHVEYFRSFDRIPRDGSGFWFKCDENGVLLDDSNLESYNHCIEHPGDFVDQGILKHETTHKVPGVIRCSCGAEVELEDSWANECGDCLQEYTGSGQALAPREQWGEEFDGPEDPEPFVSLGHWADPDYYDDVR